MILSFKQFIAEAVDADFDLKEYGAWLNVKTGKVIHVPREGHTTERVLTQLKLPKKLMGKGFRGKKFDPVDALLDPDAYPSGITIINKTPWVRVVFPTRRDNAWSVNYGKQNKAGVLKWMKGWFEDSDLVILDLMGGGAWSFDIKGDPLGAKRKLTNTLSK